MHKDIQNLNRQLEQARAELAAAKKAVRHERGRAVIEGRKPAKKITDAPAEIEDRVAALEIRAEELPYEVYARELDRREAQKSEADKGLAEIEARTDKIEAAYRAAGEAADIAGHAYGESIGLPGQEEALAERDETARTFSRARAARTKHRSELLSAKTRANLAAENLEELIESGPEAA